MATWARSNQGLASVRVGEDLADDLQVCEFSNLRSSARLSWVPAWS